jgi:hypothetical protein
MSVLALAVQFHINLDFVLIHGSMHNIGSIVAIILYDIIEAWSVLCVYHHTAHTGR